MKTTVNDEDVLDVDEERTRSAAALSRCSAKYAVTDLAERLLKGNLPSSMTKVAGPGLIPPVRLNPFLVLIDVQIVFMLRELEWIVNHIPDVATVRVQRRLEIYFPIVDN